jgi:two-component system, sensor histidine kinase PdtaS
MQVMAFRTVRARLLALMVLVVLPIAVIAAVTATMTYRSVLASVEATQIQTIGNFAVRTRIWYRETLRALLATVAAVPASGGDCNQLARRVVGTGTGYEFLAIRIGERPFCEAARATQISPGALGTILSAFQQRPRTASWVGQDLAEARYGQVVIGGRRFLGVHARQDATPGNPSFEALLLVDAVILDRSFDLGTIMPGVIVGLVQLPGQIVIARGADEEDASWLPRTEMVGRDVARWDDQSRNGTRAIFASQVVAEPDLVVLARFDTSAERAAFLQFIALLLTPLVTLAVLFAAYSLAIDSNIIRWVRGIEAAAVASASHMPREAPVDPSMPEDIRRVSEAFNRLMAEQNDRLEKLNATVGANRYLVRELHHRVKNSLQVVQSYLGLARREHGEAHRGVLSEVEAKVQVLSIAYRHALAQGEMRPVELKPLLEEVAIMLGGLMRSGQPWVSTTAPEGIALVIDRAIPLGLLAVEVAGSVQRARPSAHLDVSLRPNAEGDMVLTLETDAEVPGAADTRIAHGLLRQLEATPLSLAAGRSLGQWLVPV